MVVSDLALVTAVKDVVVVLEFTTVAVESLLCEESREVVGMVADGVVLDGDSVVVVVDTVVVDGASVVLVVDTVVVDGASVVVVVARVVVDGASQLYPAAAPLC